ncbi:LOW QUALITY PROTEIN: pre-mRNA-processing factor 40 homolog B-like [Paramacrobiotus metropolitanus]|uniref:LOW QUALITY PROTEIN: pre-mRNA-processing factor 40 homolog B-like n=1 Tax=Paramacrobiotus metropolitanus TaxID=2943436 RepID=UPI0024459EB3|nr:LOW QUALITY PROTEIN: pre-mRNA-processing factor 40 homolog B-like [Paramacrobiotus metropolitanus]
MSITEENFDRIMVLDRIRQLASDRRNAASAWQEYPAPTGDTFYYYNAETSTTTWEKPTELKTPAEIILSDTPWKEYKTPEGSVYYHNKNTSETRWDCPELITKLKNVLEEYARIAAASGDDVPVKIENDLDGLFSSRAGSETRSEDEKPAGASAEISRTSSPAVVSSAKPALAILPELEEEKDDERVFDVFAVGDINTVDKRDAAEAFRKFLEEKNIPSNINWENCVKLIQSDKRFEVWKKWSDRKQTFNQYKVLRQKQEREDQRKRVERAREAFEKMLSTTDRVSYSTPYRDAEKTFANDKIWRAVPERDREALYEDVMATVEKREKEQAERDRVEAMEKLAIILDNIPRIRYKTTWYECQKLLADSEAFVGDPVVKKINKLDALTVFKDHIIKLEKEQDEEQKAEKRQRKRVHRKNREAYMVLLDELAQKGIVHSMSKWKSVFPVIRNDSRFVNMQLPDDVRITEQFGSNALDLFKLYVLDLKNRYNSDLEKILAVLKRSDFTVTPTTDFSDYFRIIHKDDSCMHIDRGNIRAAFDSLKDAAIRNDKNRQDEIRRQEEREVQQKKSLRDNFINMLRDAKLSVNQDTKWTTIQDKFSSKSAYQAIKSEEERIELFHEFKNKILNGDDGEAKKKKSKHDKQDKADVEDSVEEEKKEKKRHHRSPSPDERESRKKRHRKSPVPENEDSDREIERRRRERREKERRADRKEERKDKVVEKAEKLANELSEAELEKQRKLLMKQLGLMEE